MMFRAGAFVLIGAALLAPLSAQTRMRLESELERARTALSKTLVQEERLVDLYYRHAMGLSVVMDELYTMSSAELTIPQDASRELLTTMQQKVTDLARDYDKLSKRVRGIHKAQAAKRPNDIKVTPLVNEGNQPILDKTAKKAGQKKTDPWDRSTPKQPAKKTHTNQHISQEPAKPTKPILLIKGSKDHSRVGRILFRAGKYDAAVRELLPLSKKKKPKYIDLFFLALSYEKLGHKKKQNSYFDKANDIFSRIEAMDSKDGPDGKPVHGRWAQTARTARQTMFWILDSGNWKPVKDVDEIRWGTNKKEQGGRR